MSELSPAERSFLADAERRIGRLILAVVPLGSAVAAWRIGWLTAAAFTLGGLLAYLNYRWIVAIVDALVRASQIPISMRVYVKLLLPVVLLLGVLYVMFWHSPLPASAFLVGFSLLVAGVLVEGMYEIYLAVRG